MLYPIDSGQLSNAVPSFIEMKTPERLFHKSDIEISKLYEISVFTLLLVAYTPSSLHTLTFKTIFHPYLFNMNNL